MRCNLSSLVIGLRASLSNFGTSGMANRSPLITRSQIAA